LSKLSKEGRPRLLAADHPPWVHHASYQWDEVGVEGELVKGGFANQILFIDPKRDVVIAYFGTNDKVDSPEIRLPLRELVAKYF
jgi:hypothetical protein